MASGVSTKVFFCRDDIKMTFVSMTDKATDTLRVKIETPRLCLESVKPQDRQDYVDLFSDPQVMEQYGNGQPKKRRETSLRVKEWVRRWSHNYPYSAFAVSDKNTHRFMGHVIAGEGDRPGQSEVAFAFKKEVWHQGYGSEAMHALMTYAQILRKEGYRVENQPLDEVIATARQTNKYSRKILRGLGMQVSRIEDRIANGKKYRVCHHRMAMA